MGFRRFIKEYLRLNKREARGAFILLFILLTLAAINFYVRQQPEEPMILSAEEQAMVDEMNSKIQKVSSNNKSDSVRESVPLPRVPSIFPFNPNTITIAELEGLELNSSIAKRVIKYRSKGGEFKTATDLSKIYGMDSNWLAQAIPYVEIEEQKELDQVDKAINSPIRKTAIVHILELNSADSASLDALPGIGPFYCRQIIKTREALGGYVSLGQLNEVYRIRPETIESLRGRVEIDTSLVRKINLNACKVQDLASHPYLSWKESKIICAWREQHGSFDRKSRIKETDVISDSTYNLIAPYLTLK